MLCTGFAMFDRFALANLSPFVIEDIPLNNAQLGQTMAVLSLAWAISGYAGGIISDITANKKRFLGIIILVFSACSYITGLATSFTMIIILRFIMGLFEGPIYPLTQAFSFAQSSVKRRGLNMGLITTTSMGIIANLAGPILLVALANSIGWRHSFFFTLVPGLITALLVFKVLKEPDMTKIAGAKAKETKPTFRESLTIYKNRNVRTSMIIGSFIVIWNVGTLTFAPIYLVNVRGFDPTSMSYIMAVFGLGAVVWGMLVPGLSDRMGRKPAIIIFSLLSIVSPLGLLLAQDPIIIGICIFVGWSGSGCFALFQAAIIGESIDTKYTSTAIASVQVLQEIGGGVIGVAVAGILADMYGLQAAFIFAAGSLVVAALVALSYYETAPLVLAKRSNR
jgi:MFS family permease